MHTEQKVWSNWGLRQQNYLTYPTFTEYFVITKICRSSCGAPFLWGPLFGQTCWTCLNPPQINRHSKLWLLCARCWRRNNLLWLNASSTRTDVTGGRKVSAVTSHEIEQRRDIEVQDMAKTRQWVQCRDWALTMETRNTMSTDETRVSRLHHLWSLKL